MSPAPATWAEVARRLHLVRPVILLALALGVAGFAARAHLHEAWLARDGVETRADVVHKRQGRGAVGSRRWQPRSVLLRFQPDGQAAPISLRRHVSRLFFDQMRVGGQVRIRYVPGNPRVMSVDPYFAWQWRLGLTGLAVLGLIGALGYGGWMLHDNRGRIRALRAGERRAATVTGLKPTDMRRGRSRLYVLEWQDSTGRAGISRPDMRHRLVRATPGSTISVVVDPVTGEGWWEDQF